MLTRRSGSASIVALALLMTACGGSQGSPAAPSAAGPESEPPAGESAAPASEGASEGASEAPASAGAITASGEITAFGISYETGDTIAKERVDEFNETYPDVTVKFFGKEGTSTRLGRASLLRQQPVEQYNRLKRRAKTTRVGPYLPLIIEACREAELSYEYRHGVTSYGAFTYALAQQLRAYKRISFKRLVDVTRVKLAELRYEQQPQILGPTRIVNARVPWRT